MKPRVQKTKVGHVLRETMLDQGHQQSQQQGKYQTNLLRVPRFLKF